MFVRRILVALVLMLTGSLGAANAQTAQCTAQSALTFPYSTGSLAISYQACVNPGPPQAIYWTSTMTYNNVSFDGSFNINGSMSMQLNFSGNAINDVVFSGGPLTYTFSGVPYTVSFSDMRITFDSLFQPTGSSGSLTINGVTYPASTQYWAYLFR